MKVLYSDIKDLLHLYNEESCTCRKNEQCSEPFPFSINFKCVISLECSYQKHFCQKFYKGASLGLFYLIYYHCMHPINNRFKANSLQQRRQESYLCWSPQGGKSRLESYVGWTTQAESIQFGAYGLKLFRWRTHSLEYTMAESTQSGSHKLKTYTVTTLQLQYITSRCIFHN